jgi:hypothetical protein
MIDQMKKIDLNSPMAMITALMIKSFHINHPVAEYNPNVRKLRELANAVITGVTQLSERERLKWWSENQVPTQGIRYYGIAATMADPARPGTAEIAGNPLTSNKELYDYSSLLTSYRGLTDVCGNQLNDSQVASFKERFWPELHPGLNSTLLGVAGTDHWGLALRVVNETRGGKKYNPYPREAMLKALATTIVLDSSKQDKILP